MATALPAPQTFPIWNPKQPLVHFCVNCALFNWKQPEDQVSLRRCTRCYAVAYCGKECQEEHWHKVHKNHCKYLGGTKKAQHSEHKKETCKTM